MDPELTHPIYRDGMIRRAKDHLEKTANELRKDLEDISGQVFVSVNKAVVTQSSSAIPVVPLYILEVISKVPGDHKIQ